MESGFFGIWQPEDIIDKPNKELMRDQSNWVLRPGANWHGFAKEDLSEEYVMLDPIKLTFLSPGVDVNGNWNKDVGIPAAIVTNYLIDKGIVCEKTDYYSWLLLNSLGTTKAKQGTLITELYKFRELYNTNAPLKEVCPELVRKYPCRYGNMGLKEHCQSMHNYINEKGLLRRMVELSNIQPNPIMKPVEAYRQIISKNVEYVELDKIDTKDKRVVAAMIVPYPPGIPLVMGGEVFDDSYKPVLEYLIARQDFENEYPGYESDIHGIESTDPDKNGKKYFMAMLIKK